MKALIQLKIDGDFTADFRSDKGTSLLSTTIRSAFFEADINMAACKLAKNMVADIITMYPHVKHLMNNTEQHYLKLRDRLKELKTGGKIETLRAWLQETIDLCYFISPTNSRYTRTMLLKIQALEELLVFQPPKPFVFA